MNHRQSFLVLAASGLAAMIATTTGCSAFKNNDRENFDSKAIPQNAGVAATCFLKNDPEATVPTIGIACGTPPFDKTIVRVSR